MLLNPVDYLLIAITLAIVQHLHFRGTGLGKAVH